MFYRPATGDDFEQALEDLDDSYSVAGDILGMVESRMEVTSDIVRWYRETCGKPLIQCYDILTRYLTVYKARNDYNEGKPVYTRY